MQINSEDIKQLYKKLKQGDVKKIAEMAGVTRQTVWHVSEGNFKNEEVVKAIAIIARKRIAESNKRLEILRKELA